MYDEGYMCKVLLSMRDFPSPTTVDFQNVKIRVLFPARVTTFKILNMGTFIFIPGQISFSRFALAIASDLLLT
jgi:hypothetical protein